jgi:hypothetical protein
LIEEGLVGTGKAGQRKRRVSDFARLWKEKSIGGKVSLVAKQQQELVPRMVQKTLQENEEHFAEEEEAYAQAVLENEHAVSAVVVIKTLSPLQQLHSEVRVARSNI